MAAVRVQATASSEFADVTTFTVTLGSSVTAGNCIIAATSSWSSPTDQNISSIADNKGNGNYTAGPGMPRLDSEVIGDIYRKPNVTTGGTSFQITVTWSVACSGCVGGIEYSGIESSPTVQTGTNSGSSTTPSVGVTPGASSLCIAAMSYNGNATTIAVSGTGGFTQVLEIDENNNRQAISIAERLSVSGSQTCNWTLGATKTWTACAISLTESGAAPTSFPRSSMRRLRQMVAHF